VTAAAAVAAGCVAERRTQALSANVEIGRRRLGRRPRPGPHV